MNFQLKKSVSFRITILGILSVVLLIPSFLIIGLINERHNRYLETQSDISGKWGVRQVLTGPVLVIPSQNESRFPNGERKIVNENIFLLPENLYIKGDIVPEIRYRGIYKAVLYKSDLNLSGHFDFTLLQDYQANSELKLEDAYLVFGISDLKGINNAIEIEWHNKKINATPGIKDISLLNSGFTVKVPLNYPENIDFSLNLSLNGSSHLFFTPIGKRTTLELTSGWPDPVFAGSFLPEQHTITEKGFTANWKVLNFNRNYPQAWKGNVYKLNSSDFGVIFKFPVDIYQKTTRTAKYAIMIIAITFLTFFMIEILGKKMLHPFQYILVGLSLLTFYTLLLALSEQIGFDVSYWIASLSIIALITLYSISILKSKIQVFAVSGILIFIYLYLYIILQLQDFALLIGSIGLFIILAVVMYLTRKIDWYNVIGKEEHPV